MCNDDDFSKKGVDNRCDKITTPSAGAAGGGRAVASTYTKEICTNKSKICKTEIAFVQFYLTFASKYVLVLADKDEFDDEQKHQVVRHVVDVHPYVVQEKLNIVRHYTVKQNKHISNYQFIIKTYSSIIQRYHFY